MKKKQKEAGTNEVKKKTGKKREQKMTQG